MGNDRSNLIHKKALIISGTYCNRRSLNIDANHKCSFPKEKFTGNN